MKLGHTMVIITEISHRVLRGGWVGAVESLEPKSCYLCAIKNTCMGTYERALSLEIDRQLRSIHKWTNVIMTHSDGDLDIES
jgi:hypothetical protein